MLYQLLHCIKLSNLNTFWNCACNWSEVLTRGCDIYTHLCDDGGHQGNAGGEYQLLYLVYTSHVYSVEIVLTFGGGT